MEHLLLLAHPFLAAAFAVLVFGAVLLAGARDPAVVLAVVGLVTISWDLVSVRVGGMTLKPSYVAFTLALLVDVFRRLPNGPPERAHATARAVRAVVAALLLLLVVATVHGGFLLEGSRQLFAVVVGGLVPAWVCFRLGREPERRRTLIAGALAGGAVAAAIGLYQFAGSYLGLPIPFRYTGAGGGLGRTAGLSYEPAFFAMYLVSLVPIAVVLLMEPRAERSVLSAPRLTFALLVLGVLAANARAGYLTLPFAVILPLLSKRPQAVRVRPVLILGATMFTVVLLSEAVRFDAVDFVSDRLASIGDTEEPASNAPRLLLYETVSTVAGDHPLLGIGPGALGHYLPEYGLSTEGFPDLARVVANNIWLQAVIDSGFLGPVGIAVVLALLLRLSRRSGDPLGRWLAFGALLVLLVGGMLTSIFWDAKYWALIGLALAADMAPLPSTRPEDSGAVEAFYVRQA